MQKLDKDGEPEKWCPRCKEWWPADTEFFFASRGRGDGLQPWCKACQIEVKKMERIRPKLVALHF